MKPASQGTSRCPPPGGRGPCSREAGHPCGHFWVCNELPSASSSACPVNVLSLGGVQAHARSVETFEQAAPSLSKNYGARPLYWQMPPREIINKHVWKWHCAFLSLPGGSSCPPSGWTRPSQTSAEVERQGGGRVDVCCLQGVSTLEKWVFSQLSPMVYLSFSCSLLWIEEYILQFLWGIVFFCNSSTSLLNFPLISSLTATHYCSKKRLSNTKCIQSMGAPCSPEHEPGKTCL